jgi:outer membrane scaffolding protein for murein synthesis (MipA/OmpV family)
MLRTPRKYRGSGLVAALLVVMVAAPASADSAPQYRIPFTPIIIPPFWSPAPTDSHGNGLASNRLSMAVGVAVATDYEGSNKDLLAPVAGATGRWHGHLFSWEGRALAVDLVPQYNYQKIKFIFAPAVSLNLDRTGTAKDPYVALLPKRKMAVDAGASIGFMASGLVLSPDDTLTVQVTAMHDVGAGDKSFVITPAVSYSMPLSKAALLSVVASMDVAGAGYGRYYFGIDAAGSAASGLPAYNPGGGIKSASVGLGGVASLRGDLAKGFAVGALLNYERLFGGFADSPIVAMRGTPNQFSATMGLGYTF